MTVSPLYLRLYPVFLGCSALGGFGLCQWGYATNLDNQELYHAMSLKQLLATVPQLSAALLLLYYACTFSRASSAFVHRMLVMSCLHQSITTITMVSFVQSAFHLSLSVCCYVPVLCPLAQTGGPLNQIVESVAPLSRVYVYPQLVHSCATYTILLALASIKPAHTIKDLNSRVHCAKLTTFSRREPIYEASTSVF